MEVWQPIVAAPKLLDLGDVAYAPTTFRDGSGRCLMLAWLQELRKGGSWDYAGCLSIPRVLSMQGLAPFNQPCRLHIAAFPAVSQPSSAMESKIMQGLKSGGDMLYKIFDNGIPGGVQVTSSGRIPWTS